MTPDNWIGLLGIMVALLTVVVGATAGFLLNIDRKVNRLEMKDEARAEHIKRLENEAIRRVEKRQDSWESTMRQLTDFLLRGKRKQPPPQIEHGKPDSDEAGGDSERQDW